MTEREQEQMIIKNKGLVYKVAHRFCLKKSEYRDYVQMGTMGLLRAVREFDNARGVAFSTFAVPHIMHEMDTYNRRIMAKSRQNAGIVSLNKELASGTTLASLIPDKKANTENEAIDSIIQKEYMKYLSKRDGLIFEKYIDGYTQQEIAEEFSTSQVQISRWIRKAQNRLRKILLDDDSYAKKGAT